MQRARSEEAALVHLPEGAMSGWRFGCALCIELHFPELFQEYAELGADCVLFSAYADDPMFGI